jgi:cytochrome c oxidase accessory protein FixG
MVFAPIIKINGNPFMLIDIANRKFSLFGNIIWAQDTYILAMVMLVAVVFIVLFTVVFGRLWCGWACPQTIFLEMVFRRIEYLFDGNYRKGVKKEEFTLNLALRRIGKHAAFILTSILITNVFTMWFIGPDRLWGIVSSPISEHSDGFMIMMVVSLFYYWIYAFFREQVCTMVCPYGRMQGVLLDSKSIAVTYDYKRGEPRGAKASGDCINCNQCVTVCPTGIDIKNGSQLECVNCTACIDECNIVMKRIKKAPNLIRFSSVYSIETGKSSVWNARTYAYTGVLLVLFTILIVTVSKRTSIQSSILRVPGTMYQVINVDSLSNMYQLKIINKTHQDKLLDIRLKAPQKGTVEILGKKVLLKDNDSFEGILMIKVNRKDISGKSTDMQIEIYEGKTLLETSKINFIGPINN